MSLNIDEARQKLELAVEHLQEELKKLRTGRAASSMLDGVMVEVYGQEMPLQHVSTVSALDAQTIQISPYDPSNLDAISQAIRDDKALGLNPSDDGKVVRVQVPPMTTERREEVVKQLGEKAEEANISLRNIRHEVLNTVKEQLKNKEISEDDKNRVEKQMDDLMTEYKKKIDDLADAKQKEVMSI